MPERWAIRCTVLGSPFAWPCAHMASRFSFVEVTGAGQEGVTPRLLKLWVLVTGHLSPWDSFTRGCFPWGLLL